MNKNLENLEKIMLVDDGHLLPETVSKWTRLGYTVHIVPATTKNNPNQGTNMGISYPVHPIPHWGHPIPHWEPPMPYQVPPPPMPYQVPPPPLTSQIPPPPPLTNASTKYPPNQILTLPQNKVNINIGTNNFRLSEDILKPYQNYFVFRNKYLTNILCYYQLLLLKIHPQLYDKLNDLSSSKLPDTVTLCELLFLVLTKPYIFNSSKDICKIISKFVDKYSTIIHWLFNLDVLKLNTEDPTWLGLPFNKIFKSKRDIILKLNNEKTIQDIILLPEVKKLFKILENLLFKDFNYLISKKYNIKLQHEVPRLDISNPELMKIFRNIADDFTKNSKIKPDSQDKQP